MNKLNVVIESLTAEMKLFEETSSRKHRTQARKTLQQIKTECHSMRKQLLGKTKTPVSPVAEEPIAPLVEQPVAPVVEEPAAPDPVEEHPIPDSQPQPVKKEKKEKKEKKNKKKRKKE